MSEDLQSLLAHADSVEREQEMGGARGDFDSIDLSRPSLTAFHSADPDDTEGASRKTSFDDALELTGYARSSKIFMRLPGVLPGQEKMWLKFS